MTTDAAPPAPARRRRPAYLLGALVLLLVVYWMWERPTGPTPAASNVPVARPAPLTPVRLPDAVNLTTLDDSADESAVVRNPFGFGTAPAAPGPAMAYTPAPFTPESSAPPPSGPPPIALKLAGMVSLPDGRTLVTLKALDTGAVFQAFAGDVVDGRYRVVEVKLQSVVVSYLDGSGSRTIPLGG